MKPTFRLVQIESMEDLSPHMRRIIFSGEQLQDFPLGVESAHVKVIIPKPGEKQLKLGLAVGLKKQMRSYTVRSFDDKQHYLTVDFAVNDHQGLVADWALQASVGDIVGIGGPGPIKYTDLDADWHLFAGDLTALPAIAATIEKLSNNAVGYAFIQVPTEEDTQHIAAPDKLVITWIVNSDLSRNALLNAIAGIEWLSGSPQIYMAGEAGQIKALHQHVKQHQQYHQSKVYASGYWKAS